MVRLSPGHCPAPRKPGTVTTPGPDAAARFLRVTGVVQGVGFRPFVHRLAIRHGITGSVRNVGGEVEIVAEGPPAALDQFTAEIRADAPPLARVERVDVRDQPVAGHATFAIAESLDPVGRRQPVSPDVAVCPACLAELYDPADRRYRYPFITCTDCGPRFTVIEAMPYDRRRTSMRHFVQCAACEQEYRSPGDRRYHSETNSCAACGPRLWFEPAGAGSDDRDPIAAAAVLLTAGGIVAVRGLGGFHLAADARNETAVARLRERKHRDAKPLAIMVRTLDEARQVGAVDDTDASWLESPTRPIVVIRRHADSGLAPSVAPGLDSVGVLLPSTPVHHLLLDAFGGPLVMTSGNSSEEPIAIGNDEARARLGGIADGLLLHDRDIVSRYDDSVVRTAAGAPIILRRARGMAPLPFTLPIPAPEPLLATGADLKNTFALVEDRRAYLSQHVGDLEHFESIAAFEETLRRFRALFEIAPRVVVHDLHPGYHSTRLAHELGLPTMAVQHHHAHIAAVMAEHGVTEPVIGVAYDGTGYGTDGAVWGAEILHADLTRMDRLAHLSYAPLPGGDLAARQPWRAALGYLSLAPDAEAAFAAAFEPVPERERQLVTQQIRAGINTPLASSMGRLFDAAAAVLGVRHYAQYEGQAAMELEALAAGHDGRECDVHFRLAPDRTWLIEPLPILVELGERRRRGDPVNQLAADFHASVVTLTAARGHDGRRRDRLHHRGARRRRLPERASCRHASGAARRPRLPGAGRPRPRPQRRRHQLRAGRHCRRASRCR